MKILVFGASGQTGREIVRQALEREYKVTAFLRDPNAIPENLNLNIIKGDVLNIDSVRGAFGKYDIVLSALGPKSKKGDKVCSEGIRNIVKVMEESEDTKRLIAISSLGVADEFTSFFFKKIILPLTHKDVIEDLKVMEKIIEQSKLGYTIVRPAQLVNTILTGKYKLLLKPGTDYLKKISRADVADFMLKEIRQSIYVNQKVSIGY